jgi:hypothetical protein
MRYFSLYRFSLYAERDSKSNFSAVGHRRLSFTIKLNRAIATGWRCKCMGTLVDLTGRHERLSLAAHRISLGSATAANVTTSLSTQCDRYIATRIHLQACKSVVQEHVVAS